MWQQSSVCVRLWDCSICKLLKRQQVSTGLEALVTALCWELSGERYVHFKTG